MSTFYTYLIFAIFFLILKISDF